MSSHTFFLLFLYAVSIVLGVKAYRRGRQLIGKLRAKGVRLQIRLIELLFFPLPLSVGLMVLEKSGVQNLHILAIALFNMVIGLSFGWLAGRFSWHLIERPKPWPGLWISASWMTFGAGIWYGLPFLFGYFVFRN